jgi:hypothetical protein
MARPNYSFAKHQREIAKKQKKEAKRLRKAEASQEPPAADKVEGQPAPVPKSP